MYFLQKDDSKKTIVSALEYFPPLNKFRTFMYCHQRSQYIRLNSKKNSFRGNYSRKYGNHIHKKGDLFIVHAIHSLQNQQKLTFFCLSTKLANDSKLN